MAFDMKAGLAALSLCGLLLLPLLCFGEQLEVTLADSLTIPNNIDYQYVIPQPNGDLQFYDLNYHTSSIFFKEFRYLAQNNELTPVSVMGEVTGLTWENQYRRITRTEYGRFYLIHILAQGFAVIVVEGSSYSAYLCDNISLGPYFDYGRCLELVAQDAVAIALQDSLIYYNYVQQTSQTLLQGAEYQCAIGQNKVLALLPDDKFMFVRDCTSMDPLDEEDWYVFGADGSLLFAQTMRDEVLNSNFMGKSGYGRPPLVHGRWYQPAPGMIEEISGQLECNLLPQEIHYHYFGFGIEQYMMSAYPFSNHRVLRLIVDHPYDYADVWLLCNRSPIEIYPDITHSFYFGSHGPGITNFGEDIVTLSFVLPEQLAVLALWTPDFPAVHEFNFPAYTTAQSFRCYAYENTLRLVSARRIYSFSVDVASGVTDAELPPDQPALEIHPNPARRGEAVTFSIPGKQSGALDVYNLRGQKISSLPLNGGNSILWDLAGEGGTLLPAGIYFARLRVREGTSTRKFIILD